MVLKKRYRGNNDKQRKIKKIQAVIDHPGRERTYYSLLEDLGDLKGNYADYMTIEPINCNEELQRVANADYELCTALLTAILREDLFSNGSFEHRQRASQVDEILKRMVAAANGSFFLFGPRGGAQEGQSLLT